MKTKIIFYDVDEEKAQQAEKMGMSPPDPDEFQSELYFLTEDVIATYINREGEIAIYTLVGTFVVPFDKQLWEKLKKRFDD